MVEHDQTWARTLVEQRRSSPSATPRSARPDRPVVRAPHVFFADPEHNVIEIYAEI
jgi:hypothetical protein